MRTRERSHSSLAERLKSTRLRPISLAEELSRVLKEAILEGSLSAGQQLVEAELKEKFGISRSPIREALRELEKKGLVEIVPRKGAFVRSISSKDIEENFPVRAVLEGLAAKEALSRLTEHEMLEMEQCLQRMRGAVEARDAKSYWEHHRIFHETFIKACGNQLLVGLLKDLRTHALWYRFSYQYYQEDLARSLSIHEKILGIFCSKDLRREKELEEMVRIHIEEAMERFLSYLGEQNARKSLLRDDLSQGGQEPPKQKGRLE
ncbi:MAG: GntR family transcriptional regulator [bacterium]